MPLWCGEPPEDSASPAASSPRVSPIETVPLSEGMDKLGKTMSRDRMVAEDRLGTTMQTEELNGRFRASSPEPQVCMTRTEPMTAPEALLRLPPFCDQPNGVHTPSRSALNMTCSPPVKVANSNFASDSLLPPSWEPISTYKPHAWEPLPPRIQANSPLSSSPLTVHEGLVSTLSSNSPSAMPAQQATFGDYLSSSPSALPAQQATFADFLRTHEDIRGSVASSIRPHPQLVQTASMRLPPPTRVSSPLRPVQPPAAVLRPHSPSRPHALTMGMTMAAASVGRTASSPRSISPATDAVHERARALQTTGPSRLPRQLSSPRTAAQKPSEPPPVLQSPIAAPPRTLSERETLTPNREASPSSARWRTSTSVATPPCAYRQAATTASARTLSPVLATSTVTNLTRPMACATPGSVHVCQPVAQIQKPTLPTPAGSIQPVPAFGVTYGSVEPKTTAGSLQTSAAKNGELRLRSLSQQHFPVMRSRSAASPTATARSCSPVLPYKALAGIEWSLGVARSIQSYCASTPRMQPIPLKQCQAAGTTPGTPRRELRTTSQPIGQAFATPLSPPMTASHMPDRVPRTPLGNMRMLSSPSSTPPPPLGSFTLRSGSANQSTAKAIPPKDQSLHFGANAGTSCSLSDSALQSTPSTMLPSSSFMTPSIGGSGRLPLASALQSTPLSSMRDSCLQFSEEAAPRQWPTRKVGGGTTQQATSSPQRLIRPREVSGSPRTPLRSTASAAESGGEQLSLGSKPGNLFTMPSQFGLRQESPQLSAPVEYVPQPVPVLDSKIANHDGVQEATLWQSSSVTQKATVAAAQATETLRSVPGSVARLALNSSVDATDAPGVVTPRFAQEANGEQDIDEESLEREIAEAANATEAAHARLRDALTKLQDLHVAATT